MRHQNEIPEYYNARNCLHFLRLNCSLLIICLVINGCLWSQSPDARKVWASASVDPQEKIKAAKALIPKDASPEKVQEILGISGIWYCPHGYGPDLYLAWEQAYGASRNSRTRNPPRTNVVDELYHDSSYLVYPATNGYIGIEFEKRGSTNDPFDYHYKRVCYIFTNLEIHEYHLSPAH